MDYGTVQLKLLFDDLFIKLLQLNYNSPSKSKVVEIGDSSYVVCCLTKNIDSANADLSIFLVGNYGDQILAGININNTSIDGECFDFVSKTAKGFSFSTNVNSPHEIPLSVAEEIKNTLQFLVTISKAYEKAAADIDRLFRE